MLGNCLILGIIIGPYPPTKTNMAMENPPFEDVFRIEHGDFPANHVSFQGSSCIPPPSFTFDLPPPRRTACH